MDSKIIKYLLVSIFIFSNSLAIEFNGKFMQGHFIVGQTETNSSTPVNVCTCTLTTRIASPKIAYWFTTILGGRGDGDNIYVKMTIESGTSASTPSSSNYLPTDNRGPGTGGQDYGLQINNDVMLLPPF